MAKHRLKINDDYIVEGNFAMEVAYANITKAVKAGHIPTAYISSNDYMAIEAMKALKENGIRVPEDVAMIGFDNVHMSEQSSPPLTTLEPKFYEMAKRAVQVLDHYIVKSKISLPKVIEYGVDLIERESC
jgi:DNA-binding LacI/PurR family transcriptional regulator